MAGKKTLTHGVSVYFSDGSLCRRMEASSHDAALRMAKAEVAKGARYGFKRTYSIGEL